MGFNTFTFRYIVQKTDKTWQEKALRFEFNHIKLDLHRYIQQYTFPYGYSHSNALLQSCLKLEHCKLHKAARHPVKCDVINDVKLFPTVGMTLYNQKLFVCLFCCFTSQINSYGHCGTVSSPNHTFFLGKLEQAVNQ